MAGLVNPHLFGAGAAVSTGLTIPSGKVAADLTGFVVMVDLADMAPAFWSAVSPDGGNVRIKAGATYLPVDLVKIDTGAETGRLFFRADLLSGSDNVFTVECGVGAALPAADPIGRNAVWSGFHRMWDAHEHWVDRTGNGVGLLGVRMPGYALSGGSSVASIPNGTGGNYVQGVTGDGTHYYVTQTNYLYKYNSSWSLVASDSAPITTAGLNALGCNHCGDPCHHGGYIYVPIENYTAGGAGSSSQQHIAVFDAATLAHVANHDISAQDVTISTICYMPTLNEFWVGTFYGTGTIYRYDTSFSLLGTVQLSIAITELQGLTYWNGRLFASDDFADAIYEIDLDGTVRRLVVSFGSVSAQGLHAVDGSTLLSGRGVGINAIHSYGYYSGTLPAGGVADWLNFNNTASSDYAVAPGLTKYGTWTLGISACLFAKVLGNNQAIAGYTEYQTLNDALRATLSYRGTSSVDRFGVWNSTDSWQTGGSAPSAGTDTVYRLHMQHDGTTSRTLVIDGSVTTDAGVATRPAGSGNAIYLGRDDQSAAEGMTGRVNWIYLRSSILSGAWMAAEAACWNDPGSFYTIT